MGLNVIFDPLVSIPLLLGIGVLTGLVVLLVYARTARGMRRFLWIALVLMRIGVLCGLIILLIAADGLIHRGGQDKPALSVLVDTSQSMNTKDDENQPIRGRHRALQARRRPSHEARQELRVSCSVSTKGLPAHGVAIPGRQQAGGRPGNAIGAALTDAVEAARTTGRGILLLSDGRSNELDPQSSMRSAARYLRTLKVPVWTVPVGTASEVKDIHVLARLNSNFLLAGQPASVNVSLMGTGYTDWTANIHLYREDKPVASKQVMLENGHAETSFPIREEQRGPSSTASRWTRDGRERPGKQQAQRDRPRDRRQNEGPCGGGQAPLGQQVPASHPSCGYERGSHLDLLHQPG
jgi:hypothetical protein